MRNKVVSLFHLPSFISLHGHGISAPLSTDTLKKKEREREDWLLYYLKPNLKFLEKQS